MRRLLIPVLCFVAALAGAYVGVGLAQDEDPWNYPHYLGSAYYTDVAGDSPHDEDIGYAREAGIIRGYTEDSYGPAGIVSREQMATYEMRDVALGLVVGLRMGEVLRGMDMWMPGPALSVEEQAQRDVQLFRWAANLIDHQAAARPDDAVWGPELYAYTSSNLRFVADFMAGDSISP